MRTPWHNARSRAALLGGAVILGLGACARSAAPFVWINDFREAQAAASDYVIGSGDLVSVQVWDQDRLSARTRVRTDGRISMPLLREVTASGKTPAQLARDLEGELQQRSLVVNPRVTVVIEEAQRLRVPVLGEVARAGLYDLDAGAGVAEALASAGGLTDFAHKDRIFVVRRTPQPVRIRFTFNALQDAQGRAVAFRLRPGDVVIAE